MDEPGQNQSDLFSECLFTNEHLKTALSYLPHGIVCLKPYPVEKEIKITVNPNIIDSNLMELNSLFVNQKDPCKIYNLSNEDVDLIVSYRKNIQQNIGLLINLKSKGAKNDNFQEQKIIIHNILREYLLYKKHLIIEYLENNEGGGEAGKQVFLTNKNGGGLFFWNDFDHHIKIENENQTDKQQQKLNSEITLNNYVNKDPIDLFQILSLENKIFQNNKLEINENNNIYILKDESVFLENNKEKIKILKNSTILSHNLHYELYVVSLQIVLFSFKKILLDLKIFGEELAYEEEETKFKIDNYIDFLDDIEMYTEQLKIHHSKLKNLFPHSLYNESQFDPTIDYDKDCFSKIYTNIDDFINSMSSLRLYLGQIILNINLLNRIFLQKNFIYYDKEEGGREEVREEEKSIPISQLFHCILATRGEFGCGNKNNIPTIIENFIVKIRFLIYNLNHLIKNTFASLEKNKFVDLIFNEHRIEIIKLLDNGENKNDENNNNDDLPNKNTFNLWNNNLEIDNCHCESFKIFNKYFKSTYYLIFAFLIRLKVLYPIYTAHPGKKINNTFGNKKINNTFEKEKHWWQNVDVDNYYKMINTLVNIAKNELIISKSFIQLEIIKNAIEPQFLKKLLSKDTDENNSYVVYDIFLKIKIPKTAAAGVAHHGSAINMISYKNFYRNLTILQNEIEDDNAKIYKQNLTLDDQKTIKETYSKLGIDNNLGLNFVYGTEGFRNRRKK